MFVQLASKLCWLTNPFCDWTVCQSVVAFLFSLSLLQYVFDSVSQILSDFIGQYFSQSFSQLDFLGQSVHLVICRYCNLFSLRCNITPYWGFPKLCPANDQPVGNLLEWFLH